MRHRCSDPVSRSLIRRTSSAAWLSGWALRAFEVIIFSSRMSRTMVTRSHSTGPTRALSQRSVVRFWILADYRRLALSGQTTTISRPTSRASATAAPVPLSLLPSQTAMSVSHRSTTARLAAR